MTHMRINEKKPRQKHSIQTAVLNSKAGWTYAAKAILQLGMPTLRAEAHCSTATEHVAALGTFAERMVHWLQRFAAAVIKHRSHDDYVRAHQRSAASCNKSASSELHEQLETRKPSRAGPFRID